MLRSAALGPLLPTGLASSALAQAGGARSGGSPVNAFSHALQAARASGQGGLGGPAVGRSKGHDGATDEVDAAARQAAHLAPPGAGLEAAIQPPLPTPPGPVTEGPRSPPAPASLEELLPVLVRKIAWSGDSRRGAVRIELGAGALAGATVLVASDGGRVRVTLSAQVADAWRERIVARLEARGLDVDVG